jgi:glycogen(starch) synthase
VGGLSRHVFHLARGLASDGHDVTVYTRGHPDAPPEEVDAGVRIVRADEYPPRIGFEDLVPWVLAFNMSLLHRAEADLRDRPPDVLHAHDWLVGYAAAALKDLHSIPLVATVHATEYGRHQGHLPGPLQVLVHQVEWWLTFEAGRVITCSEYMREEVTRIFELPPDKVETIPNGVDLERFAPAEGAVSARARLTPDGAPLICFAGRLEYEKGVQTVLEALPLIDALVPGVRFVVGGAGTHRAELERRAEALGFGARISFEGFVDEARLRDLYGAADLVIVPSLYEPFGLVALETMACGSPVIAADTGGLREIVDHDITGLRFTPGDAKELAAVAVRLLTDERLGRRLSMQAMSLLAERHSWAAVAARTADTYRRTIVEDVRRREGTPLRAVFEQRF